MTNPTGAFVYDIPEEERFQGRYTKTHGGTTWRGTDGKEFPPEVGARIDRARRVLGKAVHIDAVVRLYELWPQAKVFVRHHWIEPTPNEARYGGTGRRITEVWAVKHPDDPDSPQRGGRALKHPEDPWDRRRGIELAFRRALRAVKAHEDQAAWRGYEGAKP